MTLADLMRRPTPEITATSHPDSLEVAGNHLPLEYRFEPGAANDGITLTVPEPLVTALDASELARLIPGWRVEKITAILRALPKQMRKAVVPVPEHAARAVLEIDPRADFNSSLALWITRTTGETFSAEQVGTLPLPEHLQFNIRVVDLHGASLTEARDQVALRRRLRDRPGAVAAAVQHASADRHRRWDFGPLSLEQSVERRNLKFSVYPTLRDCGDSVELMEAKSAAEADDWLRGGVLRLAILALPEQYKYARKRFADQRELMLLGQGMSTSKPLADGLAERAFADCFLADAAALPRDSAAFDKLLDAHRATFGTVVDKVAGHIAEVLRDGRAVREKITALGNPAFKSVVDDARLQLQALMPAGFPFDVPALLWPHLARYLNALTRRLDKVAGNLKRDAELVAKVAPFAKAWREINARVHPHESRIELDRLHWMIEEFRVSLFAQDLKTALPVSEKRLTQQVEVARAEVK
jgi:ATP-dependent helicase HrpA